MQPTDPAPIDLAFTQAQLIALSNACSDFRIACWLSFAAVFIQSARSGLADASAMPDISVSTPMSMRTLWGQLKAIRGEVRRAKRGQHSYLVGQWLRHAREWLILASLRAQRLRTARTVSRVVEQRYAVTDFGQQHIN